MRASKHVNQCFMYGELPDELNYNLIDNPKTYLKRFPKGFEYTPGADKIIQLLMDDVKEARRKKQLVTIILHDNYDISNLDKKQIKLHDDLTEQINGLIF